MDQPRPEHGLPEALRQIRFRAMEDRARLIADHLLSEEKFPEARNMIREILYEFALGRLRAEEKQRLLSILQFARSTCTIEPLLPLPAYQDEEAEAEPDGQPKTQRMLFEM